MAHPITYLLPSYWVCALINGDYTGLTEEDKKEIEDFLKAAEGDPTSVDFETEGFFTSTTMQVHCRETVLNTLF